MAGVIAHAARSGLPFTFTERIVRPDGSVRTLRSGGRVTLGPDGRAARMLGVCHDMTDLLSELDRSPHSDAREADRRRSTMRRKGR